MPSDEELVAAYVAGDLRAFDEIVTRYERRVFAICLRYFGNPTDAEDAAQEAFVTLLRRAETFSGAAKFSTWMYRVTVNTCNDIARRRGRRPQAAADDIETLADALPPADDALANRELGMELEQALSVLDPQTREAIVLHDVQGVPYADIAAAWGVAVGTVKSRIHRGHARLAAMLSGMTEPSAPSGPPTS